MKIRGRLVVLATAVSGMLVVGLLFSAPAFAWKGSITSVSATCPEGSDKNVISLWVGLSEKGLTGSIEADVSVGGEQVGHDTKNFAADDGSVHFEFVVPGPENDTTKAIVHVKTVFSSGEENEVTKDVDLEKCKKEETTTTTTTETTETTATTAPPASTEAPSSSVGPTSSTEASSALPFTGSNALPMLIAALVMVVGGLAAVYAGRIRGRHAK